MSLTKSKHHDEPTFLVIDWLTSDYSRDVDFCGYSIPHPSEAKMNVRIQTTGKNICVHYFKELETDAMLSR